MLPEITGWDIEEARNGKSRKLEVDEQSVKGLKPLITYKIVIIVKHAQRVI